MDHTKKMSIKEINGSTQKKKNASNLFSFVEKKVEKI